ncbi:ras and EF-hand domain-containing protein [Gadus morhua]|uniref:EF-hand domain-containing protein n=1 Tax=Gadus morhua TaxID=8049 RepID=A0A8C5AGK9_GADMO|nr:EF-hand calcium-binding domain-containing protein 4B [Gadus morhua]
MAACIKTSAAASNSTNTTTATTATTHTTVGGTAEPSPVSVEEPAFRNGDAASPSSSTSTIMEKTRELFQMCDVEGKGFVTRRDLQRLNVEVPLNADELEKVFDTLDTDGNGYLTLNEFSSGFSEFLCSQRSSVTEEARRPSKGRSEAMSQSQWETKLVASEDEEEKHFCMLMESLGASNVFEDPSEVRSLWAQLSRDEPHLLSNFEEFLARVTVQIKDANQEKREMESAMRRKAATHDDEIQSLYEEMEQQIKDEKDRILLQDSEQFLTRSQDLAVQLSNKESELDQLFQKQSRLERQCTELHSEQHVTKEENVKLRQTNEELVSELDLTNQELALAQEQLGQLHEQSSRLQQQKEMEMYRITEGLQREQASLIKQLDLLREMNKHLRDERDMCYLTPKNSVPNQNCSQMPFLNTVNPTTKRLSEEVRGIPRAAKDAPPASRPAPLWTPSQGEAAEGRKGGRSRGHLQRIISIEEDPLPQLLQAAPPLQTWSRVEEEVEEVEEAEVEEEGMDLVMSDIRSPAPQAARDKDAPTSPRGQPVGKETSFKEEAAILPPDRLFKIILVGNSSVGKTSLLKRFCDDCFHPGTSATVGVDYSVKTILVDNSQVALQMWDTAGQERYRSITKQFFRKADGVVVMYDITSELTFTGVRQWLTSVQEDADEEIPVMILGNKTDKEREREVQTAAGVRLAKDGQFIFYECSACSGHNVMESMVHMARILKEQEDRAKEKTVLLAHSPSQKTRACC